MGRRKISLKSGVFYSLLYIIVATTIALALVWYINEKRNLKNRSTELFERYEKQQKEYLVEEVEKTITVIDAIRNTHKDVDEENIKQEVLSVLAAIRLRYEGYLFINQFDGRALLFDGKKVEGYKNVSDMVDPTGLRLFDIEKEAYLDVNGKFMEYLFKKIDSSEPEPKISFMKGYRGWEWIIGAGTYKNKPTQELLALQQGFNASFKKNLLWLTILSGLFVALCLWLLKYIEGKLHGQVISITNYLNKAATSESLIDTDKLSYKELHLIGDSLNKMIIEKRQLTKSFIERDQDIKSIFSAATNVGFVISDMKGKDSTIKEFSPGAENIFGYKKSEIIGKRIGILHHPGDDKNFMRFQKILLKRENGYQAEAKLVKKGGESFDVFFITHQLSRPDDEPAMLCVVLDISKRKKAENELRMLKNELEAKINERTKELVDKNEELLEKNRKLENFNDLFVGREFRIKELKNKINDLEKKLNNGA